MPWKGVRGEELRPLFVSSLLRKELSAPRQPFVRRPLDLATTGLL